MNNEEIAQKFKTYYDTKDVALRNELAEHYLYIAEILAKKFIGRGVEFDDLYQVASLALVRGIERFDPTLGMQFTTFITPTITGEIKNYFRDKSRTIKIPRKLAKLQVEVKRVKSEFAIDRGRNPTAKEIAEILGVGEESVLQALEIGGVVSLDGIARAEEDENKSLYDLLPSEENPFADLEEREAVLKAISAFSDTEKELLELRYFKGLSQMETAKKLGVSQMFVSRMERKLLHRLKTSLTETV